MELRHLRYFMAAADELHFGRAAEVLFVTRPSVSQTIADLEAELGVKLFFRHAQKVTLTAAGTALQRDMRVILADIARAVDVARKIGKGKTGHVNVGYGSLSLLHPLFQTAMKGVRAAHPEIDITLNEMASNMQIPAVRSGRLDVGFVYVPHASGWPVGTVSEFAIVDDLARIDVASGDVAVAMPADHRLADRESVVLSDLAEDGFILVQKTNVTPRAALLESMALAEGFSPRIVQEVANINTQMNLISVGMGVGFAVRATNLRYPQNIRIVPLQGVNLPVRLCVIWRRGLIEPTLARFLETIKSNLRARPASGG